MPKAHSSESVTTYVVDTSVFIHDPNCIERFGDSVIVVPLRVVEELDDLKGRGDSRSAYAREASRVLEGYRKQGDLRKEGVATEAGGRVFIAYGAASWDALENLATGLSRKSDNLILAAARNWKIHNPNHRVIIITFDTNMRIKAAALDMEADEYLFGEKTKLSELYNGRRLVEIEDEGVFQQLSSELHRHKLLETAAFEGLVNFDELMPNECVTFQNQGRRTLTVYKKERGEFYHVPKPSKLPKGRGLSPRNETQSYAHDLALDPEIELLTLIGKAGAGKTLMALLAAWEQLGGRYKRIIVYRPIYEVGGKELGFLPGDIHKKFGPWARPIMDNLELIFENGEMIEILSDEDVIMADDNIDINTERGHIMISPIIYIRGRSLHDSYVIVDEAQNLTPNDVKSLVTRAGRGTKVVITGDPTQIDNRYLDASSNGLVRGIKAFSKRGWEKFAHIEMDKSERSELADIGAEIL